MKGALEILNLNLATARRLLVTWSVHVTRPYLKSTLLLQAAGNTTLELRGINFTMLMKNTRMARLKMSCPACLQLTLSVET
jgi:hypothetical protein